MGNATRQMKRRRAQAQTSSSRSKWSKEKKRKVLIICAAAAAVILLFLMFWTPAGSVKTWFGKPMFVPANAILGKNNDLYYSIGTYSLPEGYVLDEDYHLTEDAYRFEVKADAEDQSTHLDYIYLSAIYSPDIEKIHTTFSNMYETCGDLQTISVAGRDAQYFDVSYQSNESDASSFLENIVIYIPAAKDFSLLVSLYSTKSDAENLPSAEELLTNIDTIVSGLHLD